MCFALQLDTREFISLVRGMLPASSKLRQIWWTGRKSEPLLILPQPNLISRIQRARAFPSASTDWLCRDSLSRIHENDSIELTILSSASQCIRPLLSPAYYQ